MLLQSTPKVFIACPKTVFIDDAAFLLRRAKNQTAKRPLPMGSASFMGWVAGC
jgi:hypothetical protein